MLPVIWTRGWSASCLACDSFSYIWSPPLRLQYGRPGFDPWIGKNPWRRAWQPTSVLLPGKSHGWRSLVGCSPWVRWESDMTEQLHIHFSLSCIGEENGNSLQYSCLEIPWMEEPGGLLSMGSHRVGHDWRDLAAAAAAIQNSIEI